MIECHEHDHAWKEIRKWVPLRQCRHIDGLGFAAWWGDFWLPIGRKCAVCGIRQEYRIRSIERSAP